MRDYALRQGVETIRNRVDKLGVAEPTIIRKGTDIIVELPGLKPDDFERVKKHHRPHRAARVQDRRRRLGVHEEGRRHRASPRRRVPGHRGRPRRRGPRRTPASRTRTSTCATKSRKTSSRSSSPSLTGDDAGPGRSRDRLRGDAGARRGRRRRRPTSYWRTYYLHKPRRADRRVPRRTPTSDLGSADRPPRGLVRSSTARAPTSSRG